MTEAQILAGCRQGNAGSQKLLFELYAKAMLYTCLRYVKNTSDAEELMLNGFYKFFSQIDKFQETASAAAWLKKIMMNECLMFLRKKGKLILMEERYAGEPAFDGHLLEKMAADELLKCILELPPGYRTIFNLFVMEELSHKEIAEMLGISEGTSKSQLSKARVLLQKIIKQKGGYHESVGR